MTHEEFFEGWLEYRKANEQQREGQSYFNFLDQVRPDLGHLVRGTAIDPYYFDEWLGACEDWVIENWNSSGTTEG